MATKIENDIDLRRASEDPRSALEVLARACELVDAGSSHRGAWTYDDKLISELQTLKAFTDRLLAMSGLGKEVQTRLSDIDSGELISALDTFSETLSEATAKDQFDDPLQQARIGTSASQSDLFGQYTNDLDAEIAKGLLNGAMDRLAIVAKEMSNLAAETAIDLGLIGIKRVQIDRTQAENWALLRELTEQSE